MLSLKPEVITEIKMERFEASAILYEKSNTCVEKLLREPDFSQWCPVTGQEHCAQTETCDIPAEHKETSL